MLYRAWLKCFENFYVLGIRKCGTQDITEWFRGRDDMRANKYGEEYSIYASVSMAKQHIGMPILKQLTWRSPLTTTLSIMFTVRFDKDLHSTKYWWKKLNTDTWNAKMHETHMQRYAFMNEQVTNYQFHYTLCTILNYLLYARTP